MADAPEQTARPPRRRRRWFRRAPINLGELAVETIAVIFGILLALAIDDWHQRRQDRAQAEEAMRAMRVELAGNRSQLVRHAQRFAAMAEAMAGPDKDLRACFAYNAWTGSSQPMLMDAAYRAAMSTQALSHLPFETARKLSTLYAKLQYTQHLHDMDIGNFLLAKQPQPRAFCAGIIREVARIDAGWIQSYDAEQAALGLPAHAPLKLPQDITQPQPGPDPAATASAPPAR